MKAKKPLWIIFSLSSIGFFYAQKTIPTSDELRIKSFELRKKITTESPFQNLEFRNIGPVAVSGRVTDIDANPKDPNEFYVAYASGGLWYTNNAGTTFSSVFDSEAAITIGDIAVDWKNGTLWVGTGESNSSRSSYAGVGIYKSTDKGKTWQNMGLKDTHHIGRITINPNNTKEVWVAAVGHLYSPNDERGIYKTTDGGQTWRKTLFVNPRSGAIDVQVNPINPKQLFAAIWHRERKAHHFIETGAESGIYSSEDGGESWKLISDEKSGFPTGENVGRIGLAIYPKNPNILYAIVDNHSIRPKNPQEKNLKKTLDKAKMKTISKEEFMDLSESEINEYLSEENFPDTYTAKKIKQLLKDDKIKISDVYNYTHNGNDDLFNKEIQGAEVYISENNGKFWRKTNENNLDGLYYTYGYYFGQIWVSPSNPKTIFVGGVPMLKSEDGGKTFKDLTKSNIHSDHHALWINPANDKILINGNDGGINLSYDRGKSWKKVNPIPVSQFYDIYYDMEKPYNVYGGMQDNGVWYGPSTNAFDYNEGAMFTSDQFKFLLGGDGMQTRVDWRNNDVLYTGFQFGNYYRMNKKTGERKYLEIPREIGEAPLRFNWEAPLQLSRFNQDIVYFCAQSVYRSLNKGESWVKISPDLTRNLPQENVPYNTITTIEESPKTFGLLYAGTDDGLVWVTKDSGDSWTKIYDKPGLWVSQIEPSAHLENRVYMTVNGYREDHFEPYVYQSEDYGKTWTSISKTLPKESVNVIREDPKNPNILYVGTDNGLYISLDRGKKFYPVNNPTLPNVAVQDLRIHHRDGELIVGTHGRSIYIADIKLIQQINNEQNDKKIFISELKEVLHQSNWGKATSSFEGINAQKYPIKFYSQISGNAIIRVYSDDSLPLKTMNRMITKGYNTVVYDLSIDQVAAKNFPDVKKADDGKFYIPPGQYNIEICVSGNCEKQKLDVKGSNPKSKREVPQGEMTPGDFKRYRKESGFPKSL